ncbi:MAG: glycosyl hydrolase [Planctomycetota bacterium]|nr:glycosyl hydrolase [Planctomycetota bacterium]
MIRSLLLCALVGALFSSPAHAQTFDADDWGALAWREVGPYRGGRSAAVAGIPQDRDTYYFGAAGGGVWKTGNAGRSWTNVSDGFFGGSMGAVAVSAWDPNVVYAGGGEKTWRGNVSSGDGVWRSEDAGKTWSFVGLGDSRHVSRLRIHPRDPNLVYAAVMGHLSGPNPERGVFRTKDGGQNWERVHFVNEDAGCVDLVMDPTNARVLYASFWRAKRTHYSLEGGGEGSGLWKSSDGGDTWVELTGNSGMPAGPIGISGVCVSPSNPENLYAVIEAPEGGVFRSRDGGKTWRRASASRDLRQRAWYYSRCYADPSDEEIVYVLNVGFHRSKDGGATYERISVPHGDNHDLWIDPADPLRMIQSNDGGANVSNDGGQSWTDQEGQPTAQMYRVSTDNAFPYRLLGGQQDNSTVRIPSRNIDGSSIDRSVWSSTAGGESGHVVAKPDDPDVVYGGSYGGFLTMRNHRTGESRNIHIWPDNPMGWGSAKLKYRFQWNFPIFTSPHDPDLLFAAAQVLFVSDDGGGSWKQISPDLTRDDESKGGPSGGPITKDNTSVEYYCTIFAAFVSPHEADTIWCGSDDGLVHVTRDGGETWANVTPEGLPEWTMVNDMVADPFRPGGCYLAGTRYKLDDHEPYLFHSADYGATWRRIDAGIDRGCFTRAIAADPDRAGLLYAGTERGVYVSQDDGASWSTFQLNLPIVPVTDLEVKQGDLVAATQGRGFWILDDLTPLHQYDADTHLGNSVLYVPRPAHRLRMGGGFRRGGGSTAGTNPAGGVWVHYRLAELEEGTKVSIDILEADGDLVRNYPLTATPGLHRFNWGLDYPGAKSFEGMILWSGGMGGPRAVPGDYRARLNVGEAQVEVGFTVLADPRSSASVEDLAAQHDFIAGVCETLTAAHEAITDIRSLRSDLKALKAKVGGEEAAGLRERIDAALATLTAVEEALYQTKNESRQDPLNFPVRLTDKLAGTKGVASSGDFRPTAQAYAVRDELTAAIEAELARYRAVVDGAVPGINAAAQALAVPAIGK